MGLRTRFNLAFSAVFLVGLAIIGVVSYELLQRNARDEVVRTADLMIEAAQAIRTYTIRKVRPELVHRLEAKFLPQTVPAFAATETLGLLPERYAEFLYKEATLNPINPRNRAADWEADIVREFRSHPDLSVVSGERATPSGKQLFVASPITISDQACLSCHSTPAAAPDTMIALYGDANGFGWKLGETIGAQIVSVPMSVPVEKATSTFLVFMGSLCAVFALIYVVLNVMLTRMIVRPVTEMADKARQVSTGDFEVPEFDESGRGEIAALGHAFNRMRRSLQGAMRMLE